MKYDTIINNFILRFPELASSFEEQFDFWKEDTIPTHCFLGDVLNQYITELLRKNNDKQQIEKVFTFYEELASSEDVQVKNLLQVTLLEYLWDEKPVYNNALKYMQPKTQIINNEISSYLQVP